jgi:acyl-CoA hydrolase
LSRTSGATQANALLSGLVEGASIYVQGSSGESRTFCDLVAADSGLRAPAFQSSLVPGLNTFDYTASLPGARLTTLLLPAALRAAFESQRVTVWPVSYYSAAQRLAHGPEFDLVVAHACPPDDRGDCRLGVTADFVPLIWRRAKRRLLIVNAELPRIVGAATVRADEADAMLEGGGATPVIVPVAGDSVTLRIAEWVAGMIRDADVLQFGIGTVPDLVMAQLHNHRHLAIHSGAIGDGLIGLAEAGALRPGRVHRAGALVGSAKLHRFAEAHDILTIVDTLATHAPTLFPAIPRFVAVNSALEVDLFGQLNLEWRGGRLASGVGGAPDFVLGARLSPGGRSIIAFQSSTRGGVSRIVPQLKGPTVSIGRHEADTVVTEHGVAQIGALALDARAQALISIAAPESRCALEEAWRGLRANL